MYLYVALRTLHIHATFAVVLHCYLQQHFSKEKKMVEIAENDV